MLVENVLRKTVLSVSCDCDLFLWVTTFISSTSFLILWMWNLLFVNYIYIATYIQDEVIESSWHNLPIYISFKIIQSLSKTLPNVSLIASKALERMNISNNLFFLVRYNYTDIPRTWLKYLPLFTFPANTSQYAHYVFNTLDQDHSGILSFEVSTF